MMKKDLATTSFCLLLALSAPAYSDTHTSNNNTKTITATDDTKTKQFNNEYKAFKPEAYPFGIGFGGIFSPNPYKNTSPTILPIPVISYQGEDLSINGPYIAYRFLNTKHTKTQAQLFLYPETFRASQSDDPQLQQLDNRNYLVMLGLTQGFKSTYGNLAFAANIDVTTRTNGYLLSAEYSKRLILPVNTNLIFFVTPSTGLSYSSKEITDYYYGITAPESQKSGLPQYTTNGTLSPYIGLMTAVNFSKHWNIFIATRLNRLSNEIYNSPMVSNQYIFTTVVSFTYNFAL
ncbi:MULTISPECIES: MipA/OmpV family protein [Cysteiniphilum]|uniref:MipA/OmpV family protein n=1 Tax=Cysteiniphilum TaxID=2056696 RepID=UPI0017843A0B|nr:MULTISPECIES: MipA/OmpV family protein [Cysteiniphilum]